jgi:ribonucleoside-diphosphate reductase subunit M1
MLIPYPLGKSNHKHLGVIQSSDPSGAFMQYSSSAETAVCNSASLILPRYFTRDGKFDFMELERATKHLVIDLNATLDYMQYPTPESQVSNHRHRPIGISVEGLADVFMIAKVPYDSERAQVLNTRIFELIYHAALQASCDLARQQGPYESWIGSPAQQGHLQFDLWGMTPQGRFDWSASSVAYPVVHRRAELTIQHYTRASGYRLIYNN